MTKSEIKAPDFTPLGDHVLVRRDEAPTRTPAGIILPDSAKHKVTRGIILAVGPGAWNEERTKRVPMDVAVGQKIVFGLYAGYDTELDGEKYLVMQQKDILGIDNTGTGTVV